MTSPFLEQPLRTEAEARLQARAAAINVDWDAATERMRQLRGHSRNCSDCRWEAEELIRAALAEPR